MLIECTSCHTQYNVDSSFPKEGRKVKCVRCDNIWIALVIPEAKIEQNPNDSEQEHHEDQRETGETEPELKNTPEDLEIPTPEIKAISPGMDDFEEIEFEDNDLEVFAEDEFQEQESEDASFGDESSELEYDEDLVKAVHDSNDEISEVESPQRDQFEEPDLSDEVNEDREIRKTETTIEDKNSDTVHISPEHEPESAIDFPLSATRPVTDHQPKSDRSFPAGSVFGWIVFLGLVSTLVYGAYTHRVSIVKELPKSSEFYRMAGIEVNKRELEFGKIQHEWSLSAGNPVVTIRGVVRNLTNRDKNVPKFVFAFHDDQNKEVVSWTRSIEIDSILAKEEQAFSVALPVPPENIKFLQVRFSNSN